MMEETKVDFCTMDNRFTEREYFSLDEIVTVSDILYGSAIDWQGTNTDLLIDAYFPDTTIDDLTSRPAIMVMHGGGFRGGNKLGWQNECLELAKRGFVAFSIQYRLGWDQTQPTGQLRATYRANQDARAAMRFIVHHANQYKVNTDWLFIGGSSAGSINALNTFYMNKEEWDQSFAGLFVDLVELNTSSNNLRDTYSIKG
ncbi:MAG: alpha/beta hydrolase, partial [Bacteroidota bacterium]